MLNTTDKIIKHKVGLLNLAEELGNVSKACKMMGLSRDTFYRYKSAVDEGGVESLFDQNRRKPNIDLAREKLNWQPKIDFTEGLDQTIAYFQEKLNFQNVKFLIWLRH